MFRCLVTCRMNAPSGCARAHSANQVPWQIWSNLTRTKDACGARIEAIPPNIGGLALVAVVRLSIASQRRSWHDKKQRLPSNSTFPRLCLCFAYHAAYIAPPPFPLPYILLCSALLYLPPSPSPSFAGQPLLATPPPPPRPPPHPHPHPPWGCYTVANGLNAAAPQ